MSKITNILLLGAAGFAVYYYSGLGVAANDVLIVFKSVEIAGITNYKITLTIQNVSNSTIQVNSLSGTLLLNGTNLGNISSFGAAVTVPANTQQDIVITLNVSAFGLPSVITQFINQPSGNYVFNISGNANVNNIPLPFNLDYAVNI